MSNLSHFMSPEQDYSVAVLLNGKRTMLKRQQYVLDLIAMTHPEELENFIRQFAIDFQEENSAVTYDIDRQQTMQSPITLSIMTSRAMTINVSKTDRA